MLQHKTPHCSHHLKPSEKPTLFWSPTAPLQKSKTLHNRPGSNRCSDDSHSLKICHTTKCKQEKKNLSKSTSNKFTNSLMQPCDPTIQQHDAYNLLQDYAQKGCPVDCGLDWAQEQILGVLHYGAHPSA